MEGETVKKANGEEYSFLIDGRGNSRHMGEEVLKRDLVEAGLVKRLKRPATEHEVLRECLLKSEPVGHCLDERYLYRLWFLWKSEFIDESIVAVLDSDSDEEDCHPHIFYCHEFEVEPEDYRAVLAARGKWDLFTPNEYELFRNRFARWIALDELRRGIVDRYRPTPSKDDSSALVSIVKHNALPDRAVMRIDLTDLTFEDFRGIKAMIAGRRPVEIQGLLFQPSA